MFSPLKHIFTFICICCKNIPMNFDTLLDIIGSVILFALMFLLVFLALAVGNSTPTY